MSFNDNHRNEVKEFKASRAYFMLFGFITFLTFGICGFLSQFMSDPGEDPGRSPNRMILLAAVFVLFMSYIFLRQFLMSGKLYRMDQSGIHAIGKNTQSVEWHNIYDVNMYYPMAGTDELMIVLIGRDGKPMLKIPTHFFDTGCRDIVEELHKRLPEIFEPKAKEFLEERKQWNFALIKNILRIKDNFLFIEFPKGKKQTIRIDDIKKVEWFPGKISGVGKGFIIIEHSMGKIKIPQTINDLNLFFYSLKYLCNLGNRVNPVYEDAVSSELNKLRLTKKTYALFPLLAVAMIVVVIGFYIIGFVNYIDIKTIKRIGYPSDALVVKKSHPNKLVLQFVTLKNEKKQINTRAEKEFFKNIKEGDHIQILYHPDIPRKIYFKGKMKIDWSSKNPEILFSIFILIISVIILIINHVKKRRNKLRIKELESGFQPNYGQIGDQSYLSYSNQPQYPPVPQNPQIQNQYPGEQTGSLSVPPASQYNVSYSNGEPPIPQGYSPQSYNANFQSPYSPASPNPPTDNTAAGVSDASTERRCAACFRPTGKNYFLSEGETWCPQCMEIESKKEIKKPGFKIMLRSFFVGIIGGIIASAIWATTAIMTGKELGIVAILIGLITGYAVKIGAGKHQGRRIQVIAVIVTLYALSYALIPIIIHEVMKEPEMKEKFKQAIYGESYQPQSGNTEKEISKDSENTAEEDEYSETEEDEEMIEESEINPVDLDKDNISGEDTKNNLTTESFLTTGTTTITLKNADGTSVTATAFDRSSFLEEGENSPQPAMSPIKAILLLLLILVLLVTVAPVAVYVMVLVSSPFSIIFLIIAVWQAWAINKIKAKGFDGPFSDTEQIDFDKAKF